MQQDINLQGQRSLFSSEGSGGLENERFRRKFLEESRGILPKIFKSRGSEMVFLTLHGAVLKKMNLMDEL